MKALRVTRGEAGARLVDVPVPVPRDDEVLIQVTAAGLCGTDVQAAFRPEARLITRPELTLGHEPAGRIVALGGAVRGWATGDRVAVSSIVICGRCHLCSQGMSEICARGSIIGLNHDGAVAEYMTAPAVNLVRLPDAVTDEVGAILTDAIPTPFHALYQRGRLQPGETVAVFGVGGLGQHAVQLAKAFGAARIIAVDIRAEQLEHARSLGADHAFRADDEQLGDRIREANGGRGVDLAGVFVGSSAAIAAAFRSVGKGGRMVVVGLTDDDLVLPPSAALARREISIIGSGGFRLDTIEQLVALVAAGRLDFSRSVSHVLGLDEAESALDLLRGHDGSVRRVVVAPKGED
ncbi:zinc-binding dehydrogenase [Acrocarpospora macrocephala]|uniref:Alcohol dehydrogenase n=1 Tax=Acrocarpospora macrocephala TaxID=150177 RepID=A0A5M3WSN4_9ACTN|nr:zinc-binding dehydrogenase [Acrocarpospora macrocephala]GES11182.1 alcohol dehydrogenase [Acrocarpospora macrocephala]